MKNDKTMIKVTRNILILSAVLAAAAGCTKDPEVNTVDGPITLKATEAGTTKALLDNGTFAANGNQVQVYDYYTPAGASTSDVYINDRAKSEGATTWPFVDQRYNWTADGTHKFFGWLHTDVNMDPDQTADAFFGSTLALTTGTQELQIPSKTLKQDTPQFDFMYSDIYVRDLNTDPDYVTAVPLEFSHLFTAFSVAAQNMSRENEITVQSVSIEGLNTTNTATIDFSGDATSVKYGAGSNDNAAVADYTFNPQMLLGTNLYDVSSKTDASQSREYFLTWPMTAEKAQTVAVTIVYTLNNESTPITKTINLSDNAWEAGKKNNINLVFKDKEIMLICTVMDWFVYDEVIDFSDQVSVSATMTWENVRSVNYETGEVILFDDVNTPATCKFHILTPKGATWTASLIPIEGHQDAFSFIEETKYGAVGGEQDSFFKLVVNNQAPIAPRHVCKLRVTVQTADGRTIVVKNLVPTQWVDANGVSHPTNGYEEFTVVQNLING